MFLFLLLASLPPEIAAFSALILSKKNECVVFLPHVHKPVHLKIVGSNVKDCCGSHLCF